MPLIRYPPFQLCSFALLGLLLTLAATCAVHDDEHEPTHSHEQKWFIMITASEARLRAQAERCKTFMPIARDVIREKIDSDTAARWAARVQDSQANEHGANPPDGFTVDRGIRRFEKFFWCERDCNSLSPHRLRRPAGSHQR